MSTSDFTISTTGETPEHLNSVDAHLRTVLLDLQDIVTMLQGNPSRELLASLSDEGYFDRDVDVPSDVGYDMLNSFALEVRSAHWDDESRALARLRCLLTFGGPNVWLEVTFGVGGLAERVTLERYWSESDSATTTDSRALAIVNDFADYVAGD